MDKRKIGQNGFSCGPVGLGAMSFAGIYGNATREETYAVLDACLDLGIDHIDTSNVYGMGRSETLIGDWFKERGSDKKHQFTIATKAAITKDPDTGARIHSNTRDHLEGELDKSLERLGVDTVDLFYVHRRDPETPVEELGKTLQGLIDTGKCRSVGISEIAPSILRRLVKHVPIAAVQSEYSLSTRSPELGLVQTCEEVGATLVAFSPVGRGLLTDNPPTPDYVAASDFMKVNPRFIGENYDLNIAESQKFQALARNFGVPAAALAIAWVLAKGAHIIPIPGTRNVDHLAELAKGADLKLTENDVREIERVMPVGWAHGDRYSVGQWIGPERYC